jgi:hypothetical protein
MKRYQQDPDVPSHLRKLIESSRADELDAVRRKRVAARLGLLPVVVSTPGLASEGNGGGAPSANGTIGGGGDAAGGLAGARPGSFMPRSRLSVATIAGAAGGLALVTPPPVVPAVDRVAQAPLAPVSISALPNANGKPSVRAATAAGKPGEALQQLDHYRAAFPAGKLREEAAVLRIEALATQGDNALAREAADQLLRNSPNTVYAARVRAATLRASRESAQ